MKVEWRQSVGATVVALLVVTVLAVGTGILVVNPAQAGATSTVTTVNADEPVWINHTVHVTIDADGEVERVVTSYEYRGELYEFIAFGAEQEGYRSVSEFYESASEEDSDANVTAEDFGDRLVVVIEETDLGIPDGYERTIEGGVLHSVAEFEIQQPETFDDTEEFDNFDVDYTIEMPGEIVDSNADSVDENVATWEVDFFEVETGDTLEVAAQLEDEPVEEPEEETVEPDDTGEQVVTQEEEEDDTGTEAQTEQTTDAEINGGEDPSGGDSDTNTLLLLLAGVGVAGFGYWYYRRSIGQRK